MKIQKLNLAKMAFYAFLGLSLTLTACSGEDGRDGVDGEMGPQGPAGQDGNANVIASDWLLFYWNIESSPTHSEMLIDVPEISEVVENGGMVLMYFKMDLGNGNSFTYTLPYDTGNDIYFNYFIVNAPTVDNVGIAILLDDPNANGVYLDVLNNPDYTLRYVLVPAAMAQAYDFENGGIPETFGEAAALFGLDN